MISPFIYPTQTPVKYTTSTPCVGSHHLFGGVGFTTFSFLSFPSLAPFSFLAFIKVGGVATPGVGFNPLNYFSSASFALLFFFTTPLEE